MKNEIYSPHKSSIGGFNANTMSLLCYIASVVVSWIPLVHYVAWLIPIILFFMEKESKLVKFHAMQSFVLHVMSAVLYLLISVIMGTIIGIGAMSSTSYYATAGIAGIVGILTSGISLVILVCAILAMVGAYRYKEIHIPIIGDIAEKLALRMGQK